ncbi:MAG TPA: hypothetical protein VFQ54_08285, partial [Thermomicrobiales bacterium]|nr:hypothetical protein [Thermomicrobiales bacterium]
MSTIASSAPSGTLEATPAYTNRELFRRFFSYYKPHRKLFWLDFSSAVVSGLLELAFPLAVSYFIDTLLPGNDWGLITL